MYTDVKSWFESHLLHSVAPRGHALVLHVCRLAVERHVQPGEAAVLRGAGPAQQAAPGALPRLQVQAPAQEDLHRGGPQAEGGRVQGHDEEPPAGAESDLHTQVLPRTLCRTLPRTHSLSKNSRTLLHTHSHTLAHTFAHFVISCALLRTLAVLHSHTLLHTLSYSHSFVHTHSLAYTLAHSLAHSGTLLRTLTICRTLTLSCTLLHSLAHFRAHSQSLDHFHAHFLAHFCAHSFTLSHSLGCWCSSLAGSSYNSMFCCTRAAPEALLFKKNK